MNDADTRRGGYLLAVALGAVAGGLFVAVATRAIPKMMSQMMSGMMRNMVAQMGGENCSSSEI